MLATPCSARGGEDAWIRWCLMKKTPGALGCIRLLVLEAQESWLLIRQIKVWTTEYDEEEEV